MTEPVIPLHENRTVYVAGVGIISALGNNMEQNIRSFENHRSGIGAITQLRTRHSGSLPVGEVQLSNRELAAICGLNDSYPRAALLSCMAAMEAIRNFDAEKTVSLRKGFISANTVGGMDKTEDFFEDYLKDKINGSDINAVRYHDCGKITDAVASKINCTDFVTTISTACSSSANAIMLGARMIRAGMLDMVIAGGVDSLTRFTLNGFNTLMILDNEQCRPLDKNRKGLNIAEGAAYIVLLSEKAIKQTGAEILCKLTGWCNTNDGYHQTAISETGEGPYLAMTGALKCAQLNATQITYINMHGTGTSNNDQCESRAVERVFGERIPLLSSTKSFTGHTLGAAGAIEAVFSVYSIRNKVVFPNFNFETSMEGLNVVPVKEMMQQAAIQHVMSNSFGFGGNCSSLIFSKN